MRYRTSAISSVGALLAKLARHTDGGLPRWYRGQSEQWPLLPSLARKSNGISAEGTVIKLFQQNAHLLLSPIPRTEWEWLYIMQHHGAPTRLLDWTESPLVALYFAVATHPAEDGELWVLLPTELNKESRIKPDFAGDIPGFGEDVLENYQPSILAAEKTSCLLPVAGLAPRNTARMQVQLGVFTIHHRDTSPVENIGAKKHVWRYTISASAKVSIATELKTLSLTKMSLFPELQSVGESVKGVV